MLIIFRSKIILLIYFVDLKEKSQRFVVEIKKYSVSIIVFTQKTSSEVQLGSVDHELQYPSL